MFRLFIYSAMTMVAASLGANVFATPVLSQFRVQKTFVAQTPLQIQPVHGGPVARQARTLTRVVPQPLVKRQIFRRPRFKTYQPAALPTLPTSKPALKYVRTNTGHINTKFALHVKVDLKTQRMYVYRHGRLHHVWAISGGTAQYPTPVGAFDVDRMYPMFIATNWNDSKMPNSIFFEGDYAIHGTDKLHKLGQPASHGCVRLHPINAKLLYDMVQKTGYRQTQIEVIS